MFNFTNNHIICFVGAGGKTTIMYELAQAFAAQGRKALVLTSTHILQPEHFFAQDEASVQRLWQQKHYAVIGTVEEKTGKLTAPDQALYAKLKMQADIVLCEADGARHLPCKLPAEHEPVILAACDTVIAVCGMDALGKPLAEVCFRAELAAKFLNITPETLVTEKHLAKLLTSVQGARKNVGARDYYIVLNKCDTIKQAQAEAVRAELIRCGMAAEKLCLRGKGASDGR